ncbi:hypothetical protein BJ742DRAFT_441519 [Cladochytrium replicatum]|nr:hypothetical protein BJ742DRAFT_441519 [Cladochytrium replicatum]
MEPIDFILLCLTMSLAICLLGVSIFRIYYGRTRFNIVLVASSALLALRTIIAVVYYKIMFLNAPARYALLFFGLNTSEALLYYLYERRLAVFFKRGGVIFQCIMYFLIATYETTTLAQMILFGMNANNTITGGYTVSGAPTIGVKMAIYIEDAIIGIVILIGTFISLGRIIKENMSAGIESSLEIYKTIVTSDALMFLLVFAIALYKAATAVDPTGATGALPSGNFGFQHLLDTVKNILMTINLILPSKMAAARVSSRSAGSKTTSSRNGASATKTEVRTKVKTEDNETDNKHVHKSLL